MLELFDSIDKLLFLFINGTLANPVTDFIMPIITSEWVIRIGYALVMLGLLIKGSPRLRWAVLFSLVALAITDQLSSNFLKHAIERLRPCHVLENVNLLVGCGGGYSMPSSHAASAFTQAILFSIITPVVRWPLLTIAILIALSRVFVGVHYPFDILVGAMVGTLVAWSVARAFEKFEERRVIK